MTDNHPILPLSLYTRVLYILLALTVVTVAVAQVDFGLLNAFIAMGIATAKAALVLLFFMHLKYDNKIFFVIFLTGVFFLLIILLFCEFDIMTRVPEQPVL